MRTRARTDRNQTEIVKALRKVGCSVQPLHTVGKGCPDILVGRPGFGNYLLEIKDGGAAQSRQKLTKQEQRWHDLWRGQVAVVSSVQEAYEAVGIKISKECKGKIKKGDPVDGWRGSCG